VAVLRSFLLGFFLDFSSFSGSRIFLDEGAMDACDSPCCSVVDRVGGPVLFFLFWWVSSSEDPIVLVLSFSIESGHRCDVCITLHEVLSPLYSIFVMCPLTPDPFLYFLPVRVGFPS